MKNFTPQTLTLKAIFIFLGLCLTLNSSAQCPVYSLSSTTAAICGFPDAEIFVTSTAAGLPVGTYTVTYDMGAPNQATGVTATMVVTTAGSGSFRTFAFGPTGLSWLSITNLSSGSCSNAVTANNMAPVHAAPLSFVMPSISTFTVGGNTTILPTVTGSGLTYQWLISTDGGANYSVLTNNSMYSGVTTAALTITGVTLAMEGYKYELTANLAGCTRTSAATTLYLKSKWMGSTSTDWNTAANWSDNSVPGSSSNVYIGSGNTYQPTLSAGTATIQNLTITPGAVLTVTNATLSTSGTITNTGTLNASNGTFNCSGLSQTIAAGIFQNNAVKNLVISAPTVTLTGPLNIYGTLSFSGTGQTLITNNNLTLKSTATSTAGIAAIPVDAAGVAQDYITGNVTMERYTSAVKAWRLIAAPVNCTQTIKATWQENQAANSTTLNGYGIQITGTASTWAADGFDMRTPSSASIKTYNQSNDTWVSLPSTYTAINSYAGYMVLIRGDRTVNAFGQAPTTTVLRTQATVATGKQAAINVALNKYTLVANPYPSALDFGNITRTGGAQNAFYVWDPKLGGGLGGYQTFTKSGATYTAVPGGGSYSGGNNYIESGEAFLVRATGSAGTITFNETSKASGSNLVSRDASAFGSLRINLNRMSGTTATLVDGVINVYDDSFSASTDEEDIKKISTVGESLSIKAGTDLLAAEKRPLPGNNDSLFLALGTLSRLTYQLEFTAENFDNISAAFLVDRFLNTVTPIDLTTTSAISFTVTNAAGSYTADRFVITFSTLKLLPVTFTSIAASRNNDKTISVKWDVENEAGINQYIVERSSDGSNFSQLMIQAPAASGSRNEYKVVDKKPLSSDNFYRIKAVNADGRILYSNIAKVSNIASQPAISIYPNPVVNKTMNVYFEAQKAGTEYTLSLYSNNGQLVQQTTATLSGATEVKSVQLDQAIASGKYTLVASNNEGKNSIGLIIK